MRAKSYFFHATDAKTESNTFLVKDDRLDDTLENITSKEMILIDYAKCKRKNNKWLSTMV